MSSHPHVEDLILVADALITDYSSIAFDFRRTNRPVYAYMPDLNQYEKERGFYLSALEEMCDDRAGSWEELVRLVSQCEVNKSQLSNWNKARLDTSGLANLIISSIRQTRPILQEADR